MSYADFVKRVAASLIDGVVTWVVGYAIGHALEVANVATKRNDPAALAILKYVIVLLVGWLYAAGMESTSAQGTLGKMALGLKVTDLEGNKVGFGRATGRHFCKLLSSLTLLAGFLMAAFTEKKQALHDILAGCLVVNK